MARKRKRSRPRLITLRGILFLHVAIYIGAILYTWWSFVDLMYRTGYIFNEAQVPILFHAVWTAVLAGHIALTALLSLLNRWRLSRKHQTETGALSNMRSDEERYDSLLDELIELRQSLEGGGGSAASYRLIEWDDEPSDEMILLEQYKAEREAMKR